MVSKVKTFKLEDNSLVEFARFTLDDLDYLADLFKTEIKAAAVKNATEEKWDKSDIWNLKSSIDAKVIDISQLYAGARSPKWINRYLKLSLKKAKVSPEQQDVIISQMSMNDRIDVAEKLVLDMPELVKYEPASEDGEKKPESFTPSEQSPNP